MIYHTETLLDVTVKKPVDGLTPSNYLRDYNITKNEWVLNGETIYYADYTTISETLEYDMRAEREFSCAGLLVDESIRHLMRFCANLWQIHAFS